MDTPKKILIIRTDRMGDVVLSTPVITNLRLAYPRAHIAFMCRPYTKDALDGNPNLDEIIIYDKYGKQSSFLATVAFAIALNRKNFDWALILHPTNRAHFISFLAAIPMRIGWNKKLSFLLNKKILHTKQEGKKHESDYTLQVLKELGIPIKTKELHFPIKKALAARVERLLSECGIEKGDTFTVVHPSASCPSKRWPVEYFCQLTGRLFQYGKVVVIASKFEKIFAQKIIDSLGVIDFTGKLTIGELGALLKRASLFISNDSGPVHIAAALKTPVISIFGRNDAGLSPLRWKPLGENSYYLHKGSNCNRCLAHNCSRDYYCLKSIKPDDVYSIVHKIMSEKRTLYD
ncbi:MAG: glycosyltransferase family 9 protein [Candidatus Omnitrophica bacterium]|nr:glycosyltransferase family 9 protein [Candidatus Omnitrophota bacterium]